MGMDNRKPSTKEQRDIEEWERQKKDQDKLEAMRRAQQRRIEQFKKDAEKLKEGEAEKAQRESDKRDEEARKQSWIEQNIGQERKAAQITYNDQQNARLEDLARIAGAERKPVLKIEFGEMMTFKVSSSARQEDEKFLKMTKAELDAEQKKLDEGMAALEKARAEKRLPEEKIAEAWVEKMKKADNSPFVEPEINLMDVKEDPECRWESWCCDPHLKTLCEGIHNEVTKLKDGQGLNPKELTLNIRKMIQSYNYSALERRLMDVFKNIERPVRLRVARMYMIAVGQYGNCFATLSPDPQNPTISVWTEGLSKNWQKEDQVIPLLPHSHVKDMMWYDHDRKLIIAVGPRSWHGEDVEKYILQGKYIEMGSAKSFDSELEGKMHARIISSKNVMGPEREIVDAEDNLIAQDREMIRWFNIEQLNEEYMQKDRKAVITITDQPTIENIANYLCARAQKQQ
jgi:hypothetical protein